MIYKNEEELLSSGIIAEDGQNVIVKDKDSFRGKFIDDIIDTMILSNSWQMKKYCYWIARQAAIQFGVVPCSIQKLYDAIVRGETGGFTVPAINLRTLTYELARAVFRSANKINAAAFILEIAKTEIEYTDQSPIEYASMVLLAAIKEGYSGSVFLQADHFQINAQNYFYNKELEFGEIQKLIYESVDAGFFNIDFDSSTLTDLSKSSADEQQMRNAYAAGHLTKFIRDIQPEGIEIAIGAEIGETGSKNSTAEDLRAFMKNYLQDINGLKGISKITVQTGTTHGGVVLPDGTIAQVNIDFDTLNNLSKITKTEYNMAGCVQQGASTLPNEAFHKFTETGCAEIHLATQFQNIAYDYFPLALKEKIYDWLHENYNHEKNSDQTEGQFIYKVRKNALGAFKREIFSLARDWKNKITKALEDEFDFLFSQLNLVNTKEVVNKYVNHVIVSKDKDDFLKITSENQ